ncbi:hypothetical protein Naga_100918g1, partial [Nannochloropsis gaditana]
MRTRVFFDISPPSARFYYRTYALIVKVRVAKVMNDPSLSAVDAGFELKQRVERAGTSEEGRGWSGLVESHRGRSREEVQTQGMAGGMEGMEGREEGEEDTVVIDDDQRPLSIQRSSLLPGEPSSLTQNPLWPGPDEGTTDHEGVPWGGEEEIKTEGEEEATWDMLDDLPEIPHLCSIHASQSHALPATAPTEPLSPPHQAPSTHSSSSGGWYDVVKEVQDLPPPPSGPITTMFCWMYLDEWGNEFEYGPQAQLLLEREWRCGKAHALLLVPPPAPPCPSPPGESPLHRHTHRPHGAPPTDEGPPRSYVVHFASPQANGVEEHVQSNRFTGTQRRVRRMTRGPKPSHGLGAVVRRWKGRWRRGQETLATLGEAKRGKRAREGGEAEMGERAREGRGEEGGLEGDRGPWYSLLASQLCPSLPSSL